MKTKKLNKKLTIKKETISNLDKAELDRVKGGAGVTFEYSECGTGHATLNPCLCGTLIC